MYKWDMKPIFKKFIGEEKAKKYVGNYRCFIIATDAYCKFVNSEDKFKNILDEKDLQSYNSWINNLDWFLRMDDLDAYYGSLIYAIKWYDEMVLKYNL